MNGQLTFDEENLIKDILKVLADDIGMNRQTLTRVNKERPSGERVYEDEFETMCESIWTKLQNGRVTVVES